MHGGSVAKFAKSVKHIMVTKRHRLISNLVICVGLAIAVVSCYALIHQHDHQELAQTMLVFGSSLMFFGFCYHLWSKGYNPAWGLSFFLIGPIAFIIFALLPNKVETENKKNTRISGK